MDTYFLKHWGLTLCSAAWAQLAMAWMEANHTKEAWKQKALFRRGHL